MVARCVRPVLACGGRSSGQACAGARGLVQYLAELCKRLHVRRAGDQAYLLRPRSAWSAALMEARRRVRGLVLLVASAYYDSWWCVVKGGKECAARPERSDRDAHPPSARRSVPAAHRPERP